MTGCGAPDQAAPPAGDATGQAVITGEVRSAGTAVGGAYVRLLDATGEFAAEVRSSPAGGFRFFAAPGAWTVRALSREGTAEAPVSAEVGVTQVRLTL